MVFLVWFVLLLIAVSDAREHRIPNVLVLLLILSGLAYQWSLTSSWYDLSIALASGLALFCIGLLFHLAKVMAPGDVKLFAGVGVFIGWQQFLGFAYWLAVASVLIGVFVLLYHVSQRPEIVRSTINRYRGVVEVERKENDFAPKVGSSSKLRMPFAPIVVIALAMNNYFG
ncbi:A24 family peptidase [Vibrio sonorensis]|uniref:A24 family peptidase n=1 Tax=Vibrio sonorensis TaxID=1004316 RepID=UPI0008DA0ADE|nr:prepilin peptidase [Vibrio sonorensis]